MRRTSGTAIWCLGVILGVTIVEGSFLLQPESDFLEDYPEHFYVPAGLGRQALSNPTRPSQTSLEDFQSIISRIAQITENQNARQGQVASETSLSSNSLNKYANAPRINLGVGTNENGVSQSLYSESYQQSSGSSLPKYSQLYEGSELDTVPGYRQSYFEGSSLGSASQIGSGYSQSYSQGSSSGSGSGYGSGSGFGQSYSQGSSSGSGTGYGSGSGFGQSYSQGSSSVSGSGYGSGSGFGQSYSQGSSSGSANSQLNFQGSSLGIGSESRSTFGQQNSFLLSNGDQQASSLNSFLNTLQQKVEQVKTNINSLSEQSHSISRKNPSNVESSQSSTNGLKVLRKLLRQNSLSNNQEQNSLPPWLFWSSSSSKNLNLDSQKNRLLEQAAILLSKLSTSSDISKSDIINITRETADDIKQYPLTKYSALNSEIQVKRNLSDKVKNLQNSLNPKSFVEDILHSLNNIVRSIRNNENGSAKSGNPNASSASSGFGRSNRFSDSSSNDFEIPKIRYILNNIENLVNDLQKAAKNNSNKKPSTSGSSTSPSSAVQNISDTLSKLVQKVTEVIDDLLVNIRASNHPSGNTKSSNGSQAFQPDQDNLESIIQQIQVAAKNFKQAVNSKLNSGNNFGISRSSSSDNDDDDDDWMNQTSLEHSTSSNISVLQIIAAGVEELLDGVNAIVSNLLDSATESNSRKLTSSLSPSDDSSKILMNRKLLTSLLNNPSSNWPLSYIVTGLPAHGVMQAWNGKNSRTRNSNDNSSPSNSLNLKSNPGIITVDETQTPVLDSEGNSRILREGSYKINHLSGTPTSGRYLITNIRTIKNPDGSVRIVKSGPVQSYSGSSNSAPYSDSGLSQNYDGSTSSSSSTQSNNQEATETFKNSLNGDSSLSNDGSSNIQELEYLLKLIRSSSSTIFNTSSKSKSSSSSDSNSSTSTDGDNTSTFSSSPSSSSTSSTNSESSNIDLTFIQNISKLVEILSSLFPSSGFPNDSNSPGGSSSSPTSTSSPSGISTELQKILSALRNVQSSIAKSPSSSASSSFNNENIGSSQNINSVTSNSDFQTSGISSIGSSSELQPSTRLTQVNNSPSSSSPDTYASSLLYPGLKNFQINSGHDTQVVIVPDCSNPTEVSASDSISDSSSASSKTSLSSSSSSSSASLTPASGSLSSPASVGSPSSLSDPSSSSCNHYQGFDVNNDNLDYPSLSACEGSSLEDSFVNPLEIGSGQYSNSGYRSVTLPRPNVISAIGNQYLSPGDQVQVTTKNGVVLNGWIKDLQSPITFLSSDLRIPPNNFERTGTIWKILSSNFKDDDFNLLEQCSCTDD